MGVAQLIEYLPSRYSETGVVAQGLGVRARGAAAQSHP